MKSASFIVIGAGNLCLNDLRDHSAIAARLVARGLHATATAAKAELFARCAKSLAQAGVNAGESVRAFFVPGRIEVLGKHTDYAGGRSVLAAADRGFCVAVRPRKDNRVQMMAQGCEAASFAMDAELSPPLGDWSNYPMTVARRLARNFPGELRGGDIALASDLPQAAGMSSSSALVVASYLAYNAANGFDDRSEFRRNIHDLTDLASYLGTCENGQSFGELAGDKGVGTFGGSEDHTAILTCKPGMLSVYSYCPVTFERDLPLPSGYTFAVAASGVTAEKTRAALAQYNRASLRSRAVVDAWREATGRQEAHIAAILAATGGDVDRIRQVLSNTKRDDFAPTELLSRFDQFVAESAQIIPAACDALAAGDITEFGRQVDRSQHAAETLLDNQVPQTVYLAEAARREGAVAASSFGAGFGGAVWAMVSKDSKDTFLKIWAKGYRTVWPEAAGRANFFQIDPGPGVCEI